MRAAVACHDSVEHHVGHRHAEIRDEHQQASDKRRARWSRGGKAGEGSEAEHAGYLNVGRAAPAADGHRV